MFLFIALLIINIGVIVFHFIKVTPPVIIEDKVFPRGKEQDIESILRLKDEMAAGWASGNGARYAIPFTSNADYVTFNGQWLSGSKAIAESHQQLFDTVLKGSTLDNMQVRGIRFISDEIAIVHMTGTVRQKGKKKPPASRSSLQTLTAVKEMDEWKFTSFHNTRISRISLWDGIVMSFS